MLIVIAGALIAYVVFKYARRHRFLRHLRRVAYHRDGASSNGADAGDHLAVVDLRTALDIETAPYRIPGARWILPIRSTEPRR